MQGHEDIIVGLDIGTSKICAVVGEVAGADINVIGIGTHPSTGLRKGIVVDIDATVDSIRKAVQEAELMAGCEIRNVYAGIAGGHITGFNSHGIIAIKGQEITQQDVARVIEAARAVAIPVDREVIHVLPQEYIVDDEFGIQNPVGMTGVRLEAKIHIVTGAASSIHNVVKCANKAGLDINQIIIESLASGESVLTKEERELGAALIDIGGGTTDLAIFSSNNIRHTFELGLGGHNLTNDITVGLRAPFAESERIKIEHGTCIASSIRGDETIEIPGMAGRESRKLSKQILGEILEPRVEEIFTLTKRELYQAGMENAISAGVVITGGTALLDGITEIAESIYGVPARVGSPRGIGGLVDVVNNPKYATAVGLILYGVRNRTKDRFQKPETSGMGRFFSAVKRWFRDVV